MLSTENRAILFQPGKLWSLWDVLEVNGEKFVAAVDALATLGQFLHGRAESSVHGGANTELKVDQADRDHAAALLSQLRDMNLSVSAKSAERLVALLEGEYAPIKSVSSQVRLVQGRMRDELDSVLLICVDSSDRGLLAPAVDHFGKEVAAAFPQAMEDIGEASACLALERWTASVFHLMRCLEVAVQVVANKLGAAITDEHGRTLPWGVMADNMKVQKINKMKKGSPEQIKWYRVHSALESVNRAYRAPTAHPKQTYTKEEAWRVFESTKGFMQELAPLA